jgi:hypothetical protein
VIACPCRAENRMVCKPRTRLNVVLRDVPFGGTWRIESTGWNAAEELPGMVDMVLTVQQTGMVMGELSIGQRTRLVGGQTKKFVVPALSLPESIEALAEGQMRLRSLGKVRESQSDLAALPAGAEVNEVELEPVEPDWIDAEIVDDGVGGQDEGKSGDTVSNRPSQEPPATATPSKRKVQSPRVKALHAGVRQLVDVPDVNQHLTSPKVTERCDQLRHGLVLLVTKGRSSSTAETSDEEQAEMLTLVGELLGDDRRLLGFADDGHVRVSAKRDAQPN